MERTYKLNDLSEKERERCEKEEAMKMSPWAKTLERSGGWTIKMEDYPDDRLKWYEYEEVEMDAKMQGFMEGIQEHREEVTRLERLDRVKEAQKLSEIIEEKLERWVA